MMHKVDLLIITGLIIALAVYIGFQLDGISMQNDAIFEISQNLSTIYDKTEQIGLQVEEQSSVLMPIAQQFDGNQTANNTTLSTNVTELQTEVIKLRNQLNPQNISQAFQPFQSHAINQSGENPYQEATEGTIAGLGNITRLVPVK